MDDKVALSPVDTLESVHWLRPRYFVIGLWIALVCFLMVILCFAIFLLHNGSRRIFYILILLAFLNLWFFFKFVQILR